MMTIKDREIVWANPFGLDAAKFDGAEITPIPGLEVTELRTTAPTTMRRWDRYFGPQNRAELAIDYMSPLAGLTDTDYSATLPNGMRVIGTQEQVDKMVAYYGKKSEPEEEAASLIDYGWLKPSKPKSALDEAKEDVRAYLEANKSIEAHRVRLTPDGGEPMYFLASLKNGELWWEQTTSEPAKACEAETAADWQDMRFIDGNAYGAQIAAHTAKRAQGTVLWTSEKREDSLKTEVARAAWNRLFAEDFVTILQSACAGLRSRDVEPEPKRSPNAKPALPSLSIEAPLGNRYGGLGWCDEA